MRRAMFNTIEKYIRENEDSALLLADIGAQGFNELLKEIPARAMNIGIFEPGMVGTAAGLSLMGITPIIYGITPFIAERALEQLKLDFAYQKLGGTFITTGAAYDFNTLGYSHYCPEDAKIIKCIPGIDFMAPGTPSQMEKLLKCTIGNGIPTFFRMTDHCNKIDCDVEYGKATVIKVGKKATIITVSTLLDLVLDTFQTEDVTILYYTSLVPFDYDTLRKYSLNGKVLICEPQQIGTLTADVHFALNTKSTEIVDIGLPIEISRNYGSIREKNMHYGFTKENLLDALNKLVGME